ncbi:MAG: hypothetical protein ACRDRT_05395, partial [Pseudonocardiaceae bacterium]
DYDVGSVAAKIGKSPSYVYQRLKLAELIAPAQRAFFAGEITAGHAILIARLQPPDQERALQEMFRHTQWEEERWKEAVSVRELSHWIQHEVHLDLHSAPFNKNEAALVPEAGACTACPKRTGFMPDLFPDIAKKDTCTDPACFQAKLHVHIAQTCEKIEAKDGVAPILLSREWRSMTNGTKQAKDAPLEHSQWREVGKGDTSCVSAGKGVVVDGNDLGKVITVCADRHCNEHGGYRGSSITPGEKAKEKRAREKVAKEQDHRQHLTAAILAQVTAPLPRAVLEVCIGNQWTNLWLDRQKRIVQMQRWGKEIKNRQHCIDYGMQQIAGMSDDHLASFAVLIACSDDLVVSRWNMSAMSVLPALARAYGLDMDPPAKTAKAGKKKNGHSRSKKAVAGDLPAACRVCGCTDEKGCGEGCYWIEDHLCSNCIEQTSESMVAV